MKAIEFPSRVRVVDFLGVSYPVAYFGDVPGCETDYRQLLYWNPLLTLSSGEVVQVQLTAPAYTGNFLAVVEGLTEDGVPVYDTFAFEIKFYNNDERKSSTGSFFLDLVGTEYGWTQKANIDSKSYEIFKDKEDFSMFFEDYQTRFSTMRVKLSRTIVVGYPQQILLDIEIPIGYTATPAGLVKNGSTGIKGVVGSALADEKIYDLQGRRVNGQPRSGVYIKGGKKVIIK